MAVLHFVLLYLFPPRGSELGFLLLSLYLFLALLAVIQPYLVPHGIVVLLLYRATLVPLFALLACREYLLTLVATADVYQYVF